jgi:hypothetical protein
MNTSQRRMSKRIVKMAASMRTKNDPEDFDEKANKIAVCKMLVNSQEFFVFYRYF